MKRPPLKVLLPSLLVAALAAATTLAHDPAKEPKQPPTQHSMAGHSAGSMELHKVMTQGQKMPLPMSGDVDKDFAAMMTMHHQQAIKMADIELQHGSSVELKALAQRMKTAQQKEITEMAPYEK